MTIRGSSSSVTEIPDAALDPTAGQSPIIAHALASARGRLGAEAAIGDVLNWCVEIAADVPLAGDGRTRELWDLLGAVAAVDVTAARVLEPHLDALSILGQSGVVAAEGGVAPGALSDIEAGETSSWGVFAAEAPGMRVDAVPDGSAWLLTGTKPWCSLAGVLTHALVTAWVDESHRRIFAVDLRSSGVDAHPGPWSPHGLADVVSAPVDFDRVRAVPLGVDDWYLERPGFAWGGMSVAACWWGGALPLRDALIAAARSSRADQVALVHAGRVDAALWAARACLAEAAALVDRGDSAAVGDGLLAQRVRAVVADAAALALAESDAALGPGPLVADPVHARRVADLHLYLRQHHGLRDMARIGRAFRERGGR